MITDLKRQRAPAVPTNTGLLVGTASAMRVLTYRTALGASAPARVEPLERDDEAKGQIGLYVGVRLPTARRREGFRSKIYQITSGGALVAHGTKSSCQ